MRLNRAVKCFCIVLEAGYLKLEMILNVFD